MIQYAVMMRARWRKKNKTSTAAGWSDDIETAVEADINAAIPASVTLIELIPFWRVS